MPKTPKPSPGPSEPRYLQRLVRPALVACWLGIHDVKTASRYVPDISAPIVTEFHFSAWCKRCGKVLEETHDYWDFEMNKMVRKTGPNAKLRDAALKL
jgi:hypothetical protein